LLPRPSSTTREKSNTPEKRLLLAPGFFVDIWKRDFAIAGIDAIDSCLTFCIKVSLRRGTVRKLDLILLAGDGLAGLIEQFDFNPVTGLCGRTCRVG
jgi:hypothetical protein